MALFCICFQSFAETELHLVCYAAVLLLLFSCVLFSSWVLFSVTLCCYELLCKEN